MRPKTTLAILRPNIALDGNVRFDATVHTTADPTSPGEIARLLQMGVQSEWAQQSTLFQLTSWEDHAPWILSGQTMRWIDLYAFGFEPAGAVKIASYNGLQAWGDMMDIAHREAPLEHQFDKVLLGILSPKGFRPRTRNYPHKN